MAAQTTQKTKSKLIYSKRVEVNVSSRMKTPVEQAAKREGVKVAEWLRGVIGNATGVSQ